MFDNHPQVKHGLSIKELLFLSFGKLNF